MKVTGNPKELASLVDLYTNLAFLLHHLSDLLFSLYKLLHNSMIQTRKEKKHNQFPNGHLDCGNSWLEGEMEGFGEKRESANQKTSFLCFYLHFSQKYSVQMIDSAINTNPFFFSCQIRQFKGAVTAEQYANNPSQKDKKAFVL